MSATIAELAEARPFPDWRAALRDAVRDPAELARLLELPPDAVRPAGAAPGGFPLLVPRGFVARMRKGDPADPLLRQVLPVPDEIEARAGFGPDPLAEHGLARHGTIRKYPGRALLITTGACPVHCRYCFRREFPYALQTAGRDGFEPALAELAADPSLREIILSGGDPLSLGNGRLGRLVAALETLPQVTTLRIHTRFPVVLPERVDTGLIELITGTRLDTVVVLHVNHPAEIDAAVAAAAAALKRVTRLLLNQSVLLAGVNDAVETLIALSQRLFACGIQPYYLHLLDRVTGTGHFAVDAARGRALIESMRRRTPGYLVPRLVREDAGELSKTPLA